MHICRVVRPVVATVRAQGLGGAALLMVCEEPEGGAPPGAPFVAADLVGAGPGQLVLVVTGGAARCDVRFRETPTDAAVVAILDPNQPGYDRG